MDSTNITVNKLKETNKIMKADADIQMEKTEKFKIEVEIEEKEANIVKAIAMETTERCTIIKNDAEIVCEEANQAFALAVPALKKAEKAIDNLETAMITELKNFGSPSYKAVDVCICINYIKMPLKDKKNFDNWKWNQNLMKDPNKFKESLKLIKTDIEVNTEN